MLQASMLMGKRLRACTELDFWGQQSDGLIKLRIADLEIRELEDYESGRRSGR